MALLSGVCFTLLVAFNLSCFSGFSQASDSLVNKKRITLVATGTAVSYIGTMAGLSQVWYSQYQHQSFRFFNDAAEWKQMDKAGHFYSAFHISAIGSRLWQWGNLPKKKADRIAALTSLVMMSGIEVFDGFSSGYGASATDLAANLCGSAFFLGQNLVWNEIRIQPKFSFHTTSFPKTSRNSLGSNYSEELIKNYNGQTYWLSADMDKFVRFPKWLNLSVGYGAGNMIHARDSQNIAAGYHPYRKYFLGVDFDLTAVRTKSKWIKTLLFCVNMIKLPAPTLEISQGKLKGHFLYF